MQCYRLLAYDKQDSHEWDTFSFSSWLLGELSKYSLLPWVTRRLNYKSCFDLPGWFAGVSFFTRDFRSPFLETRLSCCVQDIWICRSNISSKPSENVCFYFDCDLQYPGHATSTQGLWLGCSYLWCEYVKRIGEKNLTKFSYFIFNVCQLWNIRD